MSFLKATRGLRRLTALALALCICMASAAAFDGEAVAAIAPVTAASGAEGAVRSAAQVDAAAAAKAAAEEAAAEAARQALLTYQPVYGGAVQYSSAKSVSEAVAANGRALGQYKLTFYCPCSKCSGKWGGGTSSGVRAAEGRTIAVDPRKIPIGSRVFIEGYGDFIAEDVGGAIKGNKIDIFVNSHSRCYELGVQYANVYVMS